jgi:hypothetical protein
MPIYQNNPLWNFPSMMSPLCILEVGPSGLLARNAAVLNGRSCLGISGRHLLPGFYLSGQSFLMNGAIVILVEWMGVGEK